MNEGPWASQVDYWTKQLEGSPPVMELPLDRPRPAVESFRGAVHSFFVPSDLSDKLRELSRREGVTLYVLLLSAFKSLLRRFTGRQDLIVSTPIANRSHEGIEGLVGFFANTVVLRTDC